MMGEKSCYSFLRSLVRGQDQSFFNDLMGVFCTVGSTHVQDQLKELNYKKLNKKQQNDNNNENPQFLEKKKQEQLAWHNTSVNFSKE